METICRNKEFTRQRRLCKKKRQKEDSGKEGEEEDKLREFWFGRDID